jgi:hypothetical protein
MTWFSGQMCKLHRSWQSISSFRQVAKSKLHHSSGSSGQPCSGHLDSNIHEKQIKEITKKIRKKSMNTHTPLPTLGLFSCLFHLRNETGIKLMLLSLSHLQSYILLHIYIYYYYAVSKKHISTKIHTNHAVGLWKTPRGHNGTRGAHIPAPLRLQSRHFEWPLGWQIFPRRCKCSMFKCWPKRTFFRIDIIKSSHHMQSLFNTVIYHFIIWLFSLKSWQGIRK